MQRFIQRQDIDRAKCSNHFTLQGSAGALVLQDPNRIYAITEVRAAGAWSCTFSNSDPDGLVYTRNGSGSGQFNPVPWVGEVFNFTGIQEVSGFWIPAGLVA